MIKCGFTGNRCIVHVRGYFTTENILRILDELQKNKRWIPDETGLHTYAADIIKMETVLNFDKIIKKILESPPKYIAGMYVGDAAYENAVIYQAVGRVYNLRIKIFDNLQDLFDWVDEIENENYQINSVDYQESYSLGRFKKKRRTDFSNNQ